MSPLTSSLVAIVAALAVSVATAYPTKDEEAYYYNRLHDLPDSYNKDVRNLDGIGGGNLLRDLDMLRSRAAYLSREQRDKNKNRWMDLHYMDPLLGSTLGTAKRTGCCDSLSGIGIGSQKRNMDEIDRSSFNSFVKKNFDEIDRSGFGSFVKRNFDEIDRSGFGSFVKRSVPPSAPEGHN